MNTSANSSCILKRFCVNKIIFNLIIKRQFVAVIFTNAPGEAIINSTVSSFPYSPSIFIAHTIPFHNQTFCTPSIQHWSITHPISNITACLSTLHQPINLSPMNLPILIPSVSDKTHTISIFRFLEEPVCMHAFHSFNINPRTSTISCPPKSITSSIHFQPSIFRH